MADVSISTAASAAEMEIHNKVSSIIGEAMNVAFRDIMAKLQAKDTQGFSAFGVGALGNDDLKTYFENLGGAQLELNLPCRLIKGTKCKFFGDSASQIKTMGIEGSISIGIGIKF